MEDARPDHPPVYHMPPVVPFDPADPPRRPPAGCPDPKLWELAHALYRAHRAGPDGWCGCGLWHPCPAWRQAVDALGAAGAPLGGAPPRLFALCAGAEVMAYGLTLPDGSAVTVEWSDGDRGAIGTWSSPGTPARLWSWTVVQLAAAAPAPG